MEYKKTMILIPTYNEKDCIEEIIHEIFRQNPYIFVTVIDDNSPDGTGQIAQRLTKIYKNLYVIHRQNKRGLGSAYIEGFRYALTKEADFIIQMDADFSHDPKYLPEMLKLMDGYDVILGSRYIQGVRVHNWSFSRLLLSKFANLYVKFILRLPIEDSTSGFKCYRRQVIESIDLGQIKSNGYAFQIEMIFWAFKKGFKIYEMPIMFSERVGGKTKMSKAIVREALFKVLKLRFVDLIRFEKY